MQGQPYQRMHPWYKGYTGTIEAIQGKHTVTGTYNIIEDDELEITELPIGKWTRDYKNYLEELAQNDVIDEIREYHQENRVHFILKVPKLLEIEKKEGIVKKFKLQTTLAGTNYVLFDQDGKIGKYSDEEAIMTQWFSLRSQLYVRRKEHMLAKLKKECETLSNKARFIKAVVDGQVIIAGRKKQNIAKQLHDQNFATQTQLDKIQKDENRLTVVNSEEADEEASADDQVDLNQMQVDGEVAPKEYDYLLSMPLWSLSKEKIEELTAQMNKKKDEHDMLEGTHIHELWNRDLNDFLDALTKQEDIDEKARLAQKGMSGTGGKAKKGRRAPAPKKAAANPEKEKPTAKPKSIEQKATAPKSRSNHSKSPTSPSSPVSSVKQKPLEQLSLRERLAMQAN